MLDPQIERFVALVAQLPPEALAQAFDRALALRRSGGREASRATRPSASEDSALDHAVRSALLPRTDELDAYRPSLHSDAKSAVVIAARAILKRGTLSVEHYDVLVAPFIAVGVDVPTHPDRA